MTFRQSAGKRILLLACIIMMVCLIQRAFFPHEMSIAAQADSVSSLVTDQSTGGVEGKGITMCLLSSHSIQCAQPLFFDGMIPALFVFLALVMLFFVISTLPSNPTPVFKPLQRIHLKNCVFRE